jgi:hypothetical protein
MNTDAFTAISLGIPNLPGAACTGSWHIWESEHPDDQEYAKNQCLAACPALQACTAYMASLKPSKRPSGCVAGIVWESGRPKRERRVGRPRKQESA